MSKKKKYYAVKIGRKPGIYLTWRACKAEVDGFSGARYKSFLRIQDADDYMNGKTTAKCRQKIVRAQNNVGRTKKPKWTYSGTTPPWEFPGDFIACVEDGRQIEAEMAIEAFHEAQVQIEMAFEARLRQ